MKETKNRLSWMRCDYTRYM